MSRKKKRTSKVGGAQRAASQTATFAERVREMGSRIRYYSFYDLMWSVDKAEAAEVNVMKEANETKNIQKVENEYYKNNPKPDATGGGDGRKNNKTFPRRKRYKKSYKNRKKKQKSRKRRRKRSRKRRRSFRA